MTNSCINGGVNSNQNSAISNSSRSTLPVQSTECYTTVHETVCMQADIKINPNVTVGDIKTFCLGLPVIDTCPGIATEECTFTVRQNICIQIPLTFSANATAVPAGIICGSPSSGPCSNISCTYTIGFFRNHPNIVQDLIIDAGGSIILGIDKMGLSYTVTTTNVRNVLTLNTPSPPVPISPQFSGQYQNLYAQLLAANLNILNGATCDFAVSAIAAANTFLANSPQGGMYGASAVQAPLNEFNNGKVSDCPNHCP